MATLRALSVAVGVALGSALFGLTGCTTQAFCFDECGSGGGSSTVTSTTSTGQGGEGGCLFNCGVGGMGGGGECTQTNEGVEACDGVDNDCNGVVDDVDFSQPEHCGTCTNDCTSVATNCEANGIECVPSDNPGITAGGCKCNDCANDYYDLDMDGITCEYFCIDTGAADDSECNNKDDDCDGLIDEDVDLCGATDCGACGNTCSAIHGTGVCQKTGAGNCGPNNTQCAFQCDCNGPGDCWWDADQVPVNGCEYPCDITNGGTEICDGLDNDCDGLVDATDDLGADPTIGVSCFGDPDGECGSAAHAGITQCVGGVAACSGPNVLKENQQSELCNSKDDDCDGMIDDFPIDAGGSCGGANIFPCSPGTQQCINGQLVCIGAIGPQVETCNSVDDNCDGVIDSTNGMPPSDSIGACNVPPAPPAGVPQPCQAGSYACQGGSIVCVGSTGPTSAVDTCGVDANCDGSLNNQPDFQNDVANCGSCGHDCYAGAVHSAWACINATCQFQGCQAGYFDLDNNQTCEYACTFVQAQETCNGIDDNCNGVIDEGVVAPSPVQVCGVSPSALTAECTSQVTVTCQGLQGWVCGFPNSVCSPNCASATEICDTLDNDCDGALNENVANYNQPCASDDANPIPGDGACRTTGVFACNGAQATQCTAVKANCANLPNGCTEFCDGIDNDCDGSTDETYLSKGSNATFFVKPSVVKTNANPALWIAAYEASRPNATSSVPGSGNGYHSSAPAGQTLDKTIACSEPGKIPWFNVTPTEVEQTCSAIGGHICTSGQITAGLVLGEYQRGCGQTINCTWGYAPSSGLPAPCATAATATKFCNLGNTYDFDPVATGNQDGLLTTGSPLLQNCYADLTTVNGNNANNGKVFNITGNLREITISNKLPGGAACSAGGACLSGTCTGGFCTASAQVYNLMGGSFLTQDELGATCQYDFYAVSNTFEYYDTGFRCCFSTDPTL